jgi:hypothetical protein
MFKRFNQHACLSVVVAAVVAWSFVLPLAGQGVSSDQAVDEEYTRLIKEATTMPEFISPLVSYLPKAEGIPTPKDILGYIAGAPGKLTYYQDILKYMNALAAASDRVSVMPIGKQGKDERW